MVRESGGVAVVPHPFQRSRHGVRRRHLVDCDGIEVYNSMLFTGYRNRRAHTFARRRGYPRFGASDAHAIPYVGRAYTEIALPEVDPDAPRRQIDGATVVEALRAGDTRLQGQRTPIHLSTRQYIKGALRKSAYHVTSTAPFVEPWPVSMRNP